MTTRGKVTVSELRRRRGGFALPAAIGALVIAGALVTAGFYMAQQEVRMGATSESVTLALNVAQSAINDVLVSEGSAMAALAPWDTATFSDTLEEGVADVTVTRLDSRLFFVDATATVGRDGTLWTEATRRLGVVTRMRTADVRPPAALATRGGLRIAGGARVQGIDTPPDGSDGGADWTAYCETASGDRPGLLVDDTTALDRPRRPGGEATLSGAPPLARDAALARTGLLDFGDLTWDDLVDLAAKVYTSDPGPVGPAVDPEGRCAEEVLHNWGDPTDPASPCFDYFPVIHLDEPGEVTLSAGVGQGILLVENDLRVTGGFAFYGPVFIRGTLTTTGAGGRFWGGVVAANRDLGTSTVSGSSVVRYSSCAVDRALVNNAPLTRNRVIARRGWVDLSDVGK